MSDDDLIRKSDALDVIRRIQNGYSDVPENWCDAIAALPAVTVGVKPLVWRQYCRNSGNSSASAFGGEYICERAGEHGHYGVWFPCDGPDAEPRSYHADLAAAKARAQADYTARILAALEPAQPAQLIASEATHLHANKDGVLDDDLYDLINDAAPLPNEKLRQMYADYREAIDSGRLIVDADEHKQWNAAIEAAADLANTTFSGSGTEAAGIIRMSILALRKGGAA